MIREKFIFEILKTLPASNPLTHKRCPYVTNGEVVDSISFFKNSFIGSCIVRRVEGWDGFGYMVHLDMAPSLYYDFELANSIDFPKKFWHYPENKKYTNIQEYVRINRFGQRLEDWFKRLETEDRYVEY